MSEKIIAIDLGTTRCKIAMFDLSGELLAESVDSYPTVSVARGLFEQHPDHWWKAVTNSVREITKRVPLRSKEEVIGIGCCGHTPSLVLIDGKGVPVRQAITWQDTRASDQHSLIFDPVEDARRSFGSCINRACFSSLEQLLWVREHEPDVFGRTRFVLQPKDFINYKLTGSIATNTLSAKGFCDLYTGEPRKRCLERIGIETTLLPEVHASDYIIGYTGSDAEAIGIPAGVPVIAGEMDSVASILGTLQTESQISNVSGTSEIIGVVTEIGYTADDGGACSRYLCYPYKDGLQLRLGVTKTGSACIDWFIDTFFKGSAGSDRNVDRFLSEMTGYRRGSEKPPPLFLPYLNGERSPLWDPLVSGGFLGVTSGHTLEDLYLSVLEGVGFSVLANVEIIDPRYASNRSSIALSGGGSRNQLLNQIKSDIVGKPLYRTVTDSSSSVGVAMLVASGGGIYGNLFEAADAFVKFEEPYYPDRARHDYYTSLFSLYKEVYSNNTDWFGRLHRLHGH